MFIYFRCVAKGKHLNQCLPTLVLEARCLGCLRRFSALIHLIQMSAVQQNQLISHKMKSGVTKHGNNLKHEGKKYH